MTEIICTDCSEPYHIVRMRLCDYFTFEDGTVSKTWECPECEILAIYEGEPVEESKEEVDQHLRNAGYDPEALVARMRARLRKALDASPLNPKNQNGK